MLPRGIGLPVSFRRGTRRIKLSQDDSAILMDEFNSAQLFVGNLPFTATEQELQNHFAQVGFSVTVKIIQDELTRQSRGFAFVNVVGPASLADSWWLQGLVNKAIEMLDSKDFQGRRLRVKKARPRQRDGFKQNPFWSGAYTTFFPP